MELIAITGGIGSGKSVVAGIVKVMGFEVYDCDTRARELMTESDQVRKQLIEAFGNETYLDDGSLNRQHLSAVAFADKQALARLNAIVHPATAQDMLRWAREQAACGAKAAFVETALLRTAFTAQQVKDRMAAQVAEDEVAPGEHVIVNDNLNALLPQISQLINHL